MQTFKKCDSCGKFYDFHNVNFCFNLALSEHLSKTASEDTRKSLETLNNIMSEKSSINWCSCVTEEKMSHKDEAEAFLEDIGLQQKKRQEESFGFDFKLNKDFYYVKNSHNFNDMLFLKFLKSLKTRLKSDALLDFEYLSYDKLIARDFDPKNYYTSPNYLVIYEFENLQEDNIGIIIKLNNILKQRYSNNKKTFIVSQHSIEELQKFLIGRFYSKDEYIAMEFYNLIKNNFETKIITTLEKDNKITLNTLSTKEKKKTRGRPKKEKIEEEELFC